MSDFDRQLRRSLSGAPSITRARGAYLRAGLARLEGGARYCAGVVYTKACKEVDDLLVSLGAEGVVETVCQTSSLGKLMPAALYVHESALDELAPVLVALGRELLHNPNWTVDAAQKLGLSPSLVAIPSAYGYWLDKRAATDFGGRPSTWQAGI